MLKHVRSGQALALCIVRSFMLYLLQGNIIVAVGRGYKTYPLSNTDFFQSKIGDTNS